MKDSFLNYTCSVCQSPLEKPKMIKRAVCQKCQQTKNRENAKKRYAMSKLRTKNK